MPIQKICLLLWLWLAYSFHSGAHAQSNDTSYYENETSFADNDDNAVYYHNGIWCCRCYVHSSYVTPNLVYNDHWSGKGAKYNVSKPIDQAWVEFLTGMFRASNIGPRVFSRSYFDTPSVITFETLVQYDKYRPTHLLSDYINIIEKYKELLDWSRNENITLHKKQFSSRKDKEKWPEYFDYVNKAHRDAHRILDDMLPKVTAFYYEAVRNCPHNLLFCVYNRGMLHALECHWDKAIVEIGKFIELAEHEKSQDLTSKVYQSYGESCLEAELFQEAISALTKAIQKDPQNKKAYFYRAAAYFETGNFEQALQDYLTFDQGKNIRKSSVAISPEFHQALITHVCQGAADAAIDFVPSLCHSAYGLGSALWSTVQHPVKATKRFSQACYAMGECVVECCKNMDWNTVEDCVEQVKTLYEKYDQLSDSEKGELIGYTIGKYGVEIFAGGFVVGGAIKGGKALVNGASAYRKLKNVNRACNLEAMAVSSANKEKMVAESLNHAVARKSYFKNVKYNFDAHNKHMRGHNDFIKTGSEWEHKNPDQLLRRFAGKGIAGGNRSPGTYGYRETVDFGEHIGIWRSLDGKIQLPTSRGTIHYGKKGAHIVPSKPNSEISHQ